MINLGNDVIHTIDRLKDNPHFRAFREAFGDFVHNETHKALDAPADMRNEAVVRTRAFRDLFLSFEGAVTGQKTATMDKTTVVNKGKAVPVPGKGALPTGKFQGGAEGAAPSVDDTAGII